MDIRFSYDKRFDNLIGRIRKKHGEDIMKFSGVHPDQLDMARFTREFLFNGKSKSVADYSVDANANIDDRSVVSFDHEVAKAESKLNALNIIWNYIMKVINERGQEGALKTANEAIESIIDCSLYLNDSHFSHKAYCYSFDLTPLVMEGMPFVKKVKIGPPQHLSSLINLVVQSTAFISNQIAGACLYKDQGLVIESDKSSLEIPTVQEFVNRFDLSHAFTNAQGEWESSDISDEGYRIWEDGRFINLRRIYRRKYDGDIYTITTQSGKKARVSVDHVFKVMYRDRYIEVKAGDLRLYDTVVNTYHTRPEVDKESVDYRHGQFDGIIAGDGSITEPNISSIRVAINYSQKFIADFLDGYCKETFGKIGSLDKGHKCWDYRLHSREALKAVKSRFTNGLDSYTKNIDVRGKSLGYLAGFLDGIMASDGSYSSHVMSVSLTNDNMISTIQLILDRLGIDYTRTTDDSRRGNRKDSYKLRIDRSVKHYFSLFNYRYKSNQKYQKIYTGEIYYRGKSACAKSQGPSRIFSTPAQKNIVRMSDTDKRHKVQNYRDLHFDVITSIDISANDHEFVYEVETETGWYSTGGILTHNCSFPNLLIYMDYFARKDLGRRYWESPSNMIVLEQSFQNLVYSLNFSFRGSQSAFSNISIYCRYFLDELFSNITYPDGSKIDMDSVQTMQKLFLNWFNQESEVQIFTFPVLTANLVTEDRVIKDKDFLDYVSEANLPFGVLNFYTGPATCLSSCCRLRTKLVREHTNSLGTGSVSIGSHRVCTINLPRIAIEAEGDENKFFEILDKRLELTIAVLNAHRYILEDLIAGNRLPLYTHDWMFLKKQYSTVGLLGPYEACKFMGMNITDARGTDFTIKILDRINEVNLKEEKKWNDGRLFNLELIPGEQAAIKLCEADKMIYPSFSNPYVMYSNQFIPLIERADLHSRINLQGQFDSRAQGGCIMHINMDHRINNKEQMKKLIIASTKAGALYYAVNFNIAVCEEGHINVGKIKVCNKCGKKIVRNLTRVVGFITDVSDWNEVRRWEYDNRHFYDPEVESSLEETELIAAGTIM